MTKEKVGPNKYGMTSWEKVGDSLVAFGKDGDITYVLTADPEAELLQVSVSIKTDRCSSTKEQAS